jgi:hypothetical protein
VLLRKNITRFRLPKRTCTGLTTKTQALRFERERWPLNPSIVGKIKGANAGKDVSVQIE